jgi:hypothetical protein
MDSSKVPCKIWPGFDNGITNATIKRLPLGYSQIIETE